MDYNLNNVFPAQRKDIPSDLHWGSQVEVTIIYEFPSGVYFEYKNILGFIDNIRLSRDEYYRFHNGIIKLGDKFTLIVGIVEKIDASFPNHGTYYLLRRSESDVQEKIDEMSNFMNLYTIGSVLQSEITNYGKLGLSFRVFEDQFNDVRLIGRFTDIEHQYPLAEYIKSNGLHVHIKIKDFDLQVLQVNVEVLWDEILPL